MSPTEDKRNAVEAAARSVRERRRAETGQLAQAESALRRADRAHDRALRKSRRQRLARSSSPSAKLGREPQASGKESAGHRSRAIAETRTLVGNLGDLLGEGEEILDMAAGINAGHDGVLVITDRRLIFIAPRRTLSLRHENVARVETRGRQWLGTRIAIYSPEGRTTFSGIRQRHASELAELLHERSGVSAG